MCIRDRAAVALDAPSEIAQIAAANLGAKSLTVALPKGPIDVRGDGLSLALSDAVFHSPADPATEMLRLGRANICLLYTSDAADERSSVDLGGRRIIKKKTTIYKVNTS
mgnify:CR=1 FL=1